MQLCVKLHKTLLCLLLIRYWKLNKQPTVTVNSQEKRRTMSTHNSSFLVIS